MTSTTNEVNALYSNSPKGLETTFSLHYDQDTELSPKNTQ